VLARIARGGDGEKQNKKATNPERKQARHLGIERLRNACRSLRNLCGSNELLSLTILFKSRRFVTGGSYLGIAKRKL
jgi:hypothetical protein